MSKGAPANVAAVKQMRRATRVLESRKEKGLLAKLRAEASRSLEPTTGFAVNQT